MIAIIFLHLIFASTFAAGKALLQYAPPVFLVGIRMTIAGIILLLYQYFAHNAIFILKRKHIFWFAQGVLFAVYVPYIFRYWALEHMPSFKACVLYNIGPFIAYLLSYFLNNEKISVKKIIGLVVGFIGMLPILIASAPQEESLQAFAFFSWPEIAMIIAVSSINYGWLVMHRLINKKEYEAPMINGILMLSGGMLALPTSYILEKNCCITHLGPMVGLLAFIILASNIIGHNLYAILLKKYSPTFMAFSSFLTPIFAGILGTVFLGETLTWHFFLSIALVSLGLGIFYSEEKIV